MARVQADEEWRAEESGTLLMRVVWKQLDDPDRIDRRVRSYGLKPRRARRRPYV